MPGRIRVASVFCNDSRTENARRCEFSPFGRATGVMSTIAHAIGSAGYASSVHDPVIPTVTRPSSTSESSLRTSIGCEMSGIDTIAQPGWTWSFS
jgi:hypothetical protein